MTRRATLAAVAVLLAAGCGGEDDDRAGDGGGGGGGGERLREVPFEDPRPVADGRAVRVTATGTPCDLPVRRARVRAEAERVIITLLGRPVDREEVCVQVLEVECVEVPLREGLGGRRVVDGTGRRPLGGGGLPGGDADCRRVPVDLR